MVDDTVGFARRPIYSYPAFSLLSSLTILVPRPRTRWDGEVVMGSDAVNRSERVRPFRFLRVLPPFPVLPLRSRRGKQRHALPLLRPRRSVSTRPPSSGVSQGPGPRASCSSAQTSLDLFLADPSDVARQGAGVPPFSRQRGRRRCARQRGRTSSYSFVIPHTSPLLPPNIPFRREAVVEHPHPHPLLLIPTHTQ